MKIEVSPRGKNVFRLKIYLEDFTLGNLIQEELINDERIEGVGIVETHPLNEFVSLQIYVKKGELKEIVLQDMESVLKKLKEIREKITEVLGE